MSTFVSASPEAYPILPFGDMRTAYFRQVENGMNVRMALLALVLGKA